MEHQCKQEVALKADNKSELIKYLLEKYAHYAHTGGVKDDGQAAR